MKTWNGRHNRFVIMLNESERKIIEELAKKEKLPASTMARRMLLLKAQEKEDSE